MAQDPYYRQMLEWSKQQAAQQAQRQQEQVNIQRINEERERLRREHLERIRIYEAQVANAAAAAASSSAAGAGGAGGGGRRKSTGIPTINGHAELILFSVLGSDNWHYVILDYLNETISDIKDTGVSNSEGYDTVIIENSGFVFEFDTKVVFINDNAEIIESLDNSIYSARSRKDHYYALFDDGTLYQFDGKVVTTYTIPMGSDYTDFNLTKNSIVITAGDTNFDTRVYVWNPTIGVVNVWTGSGSNGLTNRYNGVNSNNNASFFVVSEYNDVADGWKTLNIYGDDGTTKSPLDITTLATNLSYGIPTIFGDNKLEFFVHRSATPASTSYYLNIYDYYTDIWRAATHTKTNYSTGYDNIYFQDTYSGSQYTSLSNGIFRLLYNAGSTASVYNIDLYRYVDVIYSIDGATHSTYTVNNSGTNNKGIDINDANREPNGNSLYIGKSIFLPMYLNDSKISLLCLTSTQSTVINAGSNTGLTGTQGEGLIPGWNSGQKYVSFRVGDNFGIWLSYATADVYKIYNQSGTNVISLTMSTGTRLNYTGDLAVVTDNTAGIEYVFTENPISLGLSPSYATYSTLSINQYGLKPTYSDGSTTTSLMMNLATASTPSRIFATSSVYEFTLPATTYDSWLSDVYSVHLGKDTNYILYFYDWTGILLATVDTGIVSTASYTADLISDRVYFRVIDGTTTTYYYFSPTKSDSISIENVDEDTRLYDYWPTN